MVGCLRLVYGLYLAWKDGLVGWEGGAQASCGNGDAEYAIETGMRVRFEHDLLERYIE